MFTKSIRWRLLLWLAFLLACVLSGFAVTVYQLQRLHQFGQIDQDLERRVAVLGSAVRGGPPRFGQRPPGFPDNNGPGPFRRGDPGYGDDRGPGPPPPHGGPRDMRFGPRDFGPREVRLTAEVASLFDESRTNGFYFAIWSRNGTALKRSTNAPAELAIPEAL